MEKAEKEEKTEDDAFSVNDWDIEKGIFNLVIALVQQRTQRLDAQIARQSVIEFLESIIAGLSESTDTLDDKINEFIKQQRAEENND